MGVMTYQQPRDGSTAIRGDAYTTNQDKNPEKTTQQNPGTNKTTESDEEGATTVITGIAEKKADTAMNTANRRTPYARTPRTRGAQKERYGRG
jgi:hypothetical protein